MTRNKMMTFYGGVLHRKTLQVPDTHDRYLYSPDVSTLAYRATMAGLLGKQSITVQSPMSFAEGTVAPLGQHPQEYHRRTVVAVSPTTQILEECFVHYSWTNSRVVKENGVGSYPLPEVYHIIGSSSVAWIGYSDLYQTLDVCLRDPKLADEGVVHPTEVRRFWGVPGEVILRFLKADSKGRFFNDTIKKVYGPSVKMPYTAWHMNNPS